MKRVIAVFVALLIVNAAMALQTNVYDMDKLFFYGIEKTGLLDPSIEVEGIVKKGDALVSIRAKIYKIGYIGLLDADRIPIRCTTSTCLLRNFRVKKMLPSNPLAQQWSGIVLADLEVDQNSDKTLEWKEEGLNIGFLTKDGVIKINPDIKFYYVETIPDSLWEKATSPETKSVTATWDARF